MQTLDPTQTAMTDKATAGIDRLSSGAHQAVDRMAQAATSASSGVHQAVDRVAQAATSAAEQIGQRGAQIRDRQEYWTESARECVRRHPIASVGIAVGVGLLLSIFNNRGVRH